MCFYRAMHFNAIKNRVARCPVFDRTVRFLAICLVKNIMVNRTTLLADLERSTTYYDSPLPKTSSWMDLHEIWSVDSQQKLKIIKIVVTSRQISRLKCAKLDFAWGYAPDPAEGAYSAPIQTP